MTQSLPDLEQQREVIAQRIAQLGDLRPGSITGTSGRCGKPDCRCHQPGEPGHGRALRPAALRGQVVGDAVLLPVALEHLDDPRMEWDAVDSAILEVLPLRLARDHDARKARLDG